MKALTQPTDSQIDRGIRKAPTVTSAPTEVRVFEIFFKDVYNGGIVAGLSYIILVFV